MRLLIFGLGYCGRAAATLACEAGWEVVATSRSPGPARQPGLRVVPFDSAGPEIAGATHILVTAPPSAEPAGEGADPVLARYAAQLRAARSIAWFGYLSTTGVYGDRGGGWVDETTEPAPTAQRSRRRLAAEIAWRAVAGMVPREGTIEAGSKGAPNASGDGTPSMSHDNAPTACRESVLSASRGNAQSASHGSAQPASHGSAQPASHGSAQSASHGSAQSASHGSAPSAASADAAPKASDGAPSTSYDAPRSLDIFRLAGIYGPGRSSFDDLRAGRARRVVQPGHAFGRIHVDDISAGIMAAITRPAAGTRVLNFSDDEPAESADVIAEAARLLGVPVPPAIPFEQAFASMSGMARSFWSENRRVASRATQDALARRWRYPTYREGLQAILASEQAACPADGAET